MKRNIIIIFVIIVIIIIVIGCTNNSKNNNQNKKSIPPLNILITNKDIVKYNGSLVILDDINNVINKSNFSLEPNGNKDIENITSKKGKYFISVILEDSRNKTYPVYVSEYAYYVYVNLYHDEIEITQTVE